MSFNLCTSQAIMRKAGFYANSDAIASGTLLAEYCDQAEAEFSVATKKDWASSAVWATVPTSLRNAIGQAVASRAAIDVIEYDIAGYTTKVAETMLDVLRDNYIRLVEQVKEQDIQNFILGSNNT